MPTIPILKNIINLVPHLTSKESMDAAVAAALQNLPENNKHVLRAAEFYNQLATSPHSGLLEPGNLQRTSVEEETLQKVRKIFPDAIRRESIGAVAIFMHHENNAKDTEEIKKAIPLKKNASREQIALVQEFAEAVYLAKQQPPQTQKITSSEPAPTKSAQTLQERLAALPGKSTTVNEKSGITDPSSPMRGKKLEASIENARNTFSKGQITIIDDALATWGHEKRDIQKWNVDMECG